MDVAPACLGPGRGRAMSQPVVPATVETHVMGPETRRGWPVHAAWAFYYYGPSGPRIFLFFFFLPHES